MSEISKHPEMGSIISSIRKICKDLPCDDCSHLKDDLNAAKSREKHWKDKFDEIKEQQEGSTIPNELMRIFCKGAFPEDEFEDVTEWRQKGERWFPYEAGNQKSESGFEIDLKFFKNEDNDGK